MTENTTPQTLPRVRAVTPTRKFPYGLSIIWSDGKKSSVDLTGLVHTSRHFKIFLSQPKDFRRVRPDEFGTGI
jgi:hypothetical protein